MQSKRNDTEALAYAKKLFRETGVPLIKICRGLTSLLWEETLYIPTIEEWLGLFLDAEYVITNSFHGMAFSVNFQKEFTVFLEGDSASGRNSRIYDRCKDFGLMDRFCVVGKEQISTPKRIDYTAVSNVLERMKKDSITWLRKEICLN